MLCCMVGLLVMCGFVMFLFFFFILLVVGLCLCRVMFLMGCCCWCVV